MKRPSSNPPRDELEIKIIKLFVLPERQERLLFLQARRREEFVRAFHTEKFLNPAVATRVTLATDIFALMKKLGASGECYAVSAQRELDARTLPLDEVLAQCVGSTIETVLISPGTGVGYYEGGGYTERYVLVGNGTTANTLLKLAPVGRGTSRKRDVRSSWVWLASSAQRCQSCRSMQIASRSDVGHI